MKRRFYFHRQNAPLEADHVIYVLWCGESVREQKMLAKMVAWSFEHGATLRSWSEDVDYYLDLEATRVFPGRGLLDFGFVRCDINATDLLILMEDQSFDSYEAALTVPKTFLYQVSTLARPSIDTAAGRIINRQSQSLLRKNLSENRGYQPALISFI